MTSERHLVRVEVRVSLPSVKIGFEKKRYDKGKFDNNSTSSWSKDDACAFVGRGMGGGSFNRRYIAALWFFSRLPRYTTAGIQK